MTRKHQLVAALLFALPIGGVASAQPAPTPDPDQPAPNQAPAPAPAPDDASGPVTCPPPPGESNEACPAPQQAQAEPSTPPPAQAGTVPPNPENYGPHPAWMALTVGGGVDDFANSALRNATDIGGSWNLRLTFGQHYWISGEALYIGSAQQMAGLNQRNIDVVGNGAQADLRINGTISFPVQPFVYSGVAYRHYSLTNTTSQFSDVGVGDANNVFEVPLGAGIAAYFGNLMIDVRGEYRWGFGGNNTVNGTLDRWGTTGNFGFEF